MPTNLMIGIAGTAAAVVLAAGSTVALAAVSGGMGSSSVGAAYGPFGGRSAAQNTTSSCTVPSLPGNVVDVALTDMGGMMGGGRGGYGGMMGGGRGGYGGYGYGMMSVQVNPTTVTAGTVSLSVANDGVRTHELVVLPLSDGARVGQRAVGSDGRVSEAGSLGEASNTCAAGEGDGIAAGSDGWVTLDLKPGRYELVCNLPGHYAAGMFAELDVTS